MLLINLAGRLVLELAAIGAVGFWGYQAVGPLPGRIALAVGAVVALVVFWAVVVAPNATNAISPEVRVLIGSVVLLLAAGALATAGQTTLALVFGGAVIVNTVILFVLGHDAP